jgi:hypothetical protein
MGLKQGLVKERNIKLPTKSFNEPMENLHIHKWPIQFEKNRTLVRYEYRHRGVFFLEESYLCSLNKQYGLFKHSFPLVIKAAEQIRAYPELAEFTLLLYFSMQDRHFFIESLDEIALPEDPSATQIFAWDFVLLMALMPTIPHTVQSMRSKGVPEDVIMNNLRFFENAIDSFKLRFDRPGGMTLTGFKWYQRYVDGNILSISRLSFEVSRSFDGSIKAFRSDTGEICLLMSDANVHAKGMLVGVPGFEDEVGAFYAKIKETSTYWEGYPVSKDGYAQKKLVRLLKSKWKLILSPGDPIIWVHIPSKGSFKKEYVEETYVRARKIIKQCYPDYHFKAFTCFSWLLDPQLNNFLNSDSNILSFQKKYILFPRESRGKSVFNFIYKKPFDNYEQLTENTSLERAIKQHYINGGYIYDMGGVFFM